MVVSPAMAKAYHDYPRVTPKGLPTPFRGPKRPARFPPGQALQSELRRIGLLRTFSGPEEASSANAAEVFGWMCSVPLCTLIEKWHRHRLWASLNAGMRVTGPAVSRLEA